MNFTVNNDNEKSIKCWLEKGKEGIVDFHVGDFIIAGLSKDGVLEIYDGIFENNKCGIATWSEIGSFGIGEVVIKHVPFYKRFDV